MPKTSAGILMYRNRSGVLEVLLVHPGGPFWAKKDEGAWSIPKGEIDPDENPLGAACREFKEELGTNITGEFKELMPVIQKSGKKVLAWAIEGDLDASKIKSNTLTIEWPPRSARSLEIPEVDRASWLSLEEAKTKINPGQVPLIEELENLLRSR